MTITPQEIKAAAEERRRAWVKANGLNIHTINLDRRMIDRWKRVEEIGREHPWINFVRQPAIDLRAHPWIACTFGHQLAVFEAKLADAPFTLVAEDDLEPTRWFERLPHIIDLGDAREFGAVYCGTVSYPDLIVDDSEADSCIVETDTILSSHLTIYYKRGYDAVLSIPCGGGSDWNRDPAVPTEHQERMATTYPKLKRGLAVPFLATQRSDYSDNCKRNVCLTQAFRDAENAWIQAGRLKTNRVGS